MSTTDDDEVFADIRGLAGGLGLAARPFEHDEVAAEEMLELVLSPRAHARPPTRTRRVRRARAVAASIAVAASAVGLFSVTGGPDPGGADSEAAGSGGGDSAASSSVENRRLRDLARADTYKAGGTMAELSGTSDVATAPGSVVVVDGVTAGARTRATVVESLRGPIEVGTRIEVFIPFLHLSPGLGGAQRFVLFVVGSGPYQAYGMYAEATPGELVTTQVGDDVGLRRLSLDELRTALR